MARPSLDDYFGDWKAREALAQQMIPMIGMLENKKGVLTFLYGRALNNRSTANIMKSHRRIREVARNELSEFESHSMLAAMCKLNLCPSQIDLGKLTVKYMELSENQKQAPDIDTFVKKELAHLIDVDFKPIAKPTDVVLYGFTAFARQ